MSVNKQTAYAKLLAQAFVADPLFALAFADTDKSKTERAKQWYIEVLLKYCQQCGNIITTPDELGVIAWSKGTHFPLHFTPETFRGVEADIIEKVNRIGEHEGVIEQYIVEHASNYGYICLMGVDIRVRGRGYAKQLLNAAKQQMAEQGIVYCWLTTENPNNVSLYRKNGFTLVDQFKTNMGIDAYFFKQEISNT